MTAQNETVLAYVHNETVLAYEHVVALDIVQVFIFILVLLGIFLNIMTIAALVHLPWSSRPNLRLVLSLCVANITFAVNFVLYMITFYINPEGNGYEASCLLYETVRCVVYIFIYLNVTSLVLDLYLAVTNPLGYAAIVTISRTNKLLVLNGFISMVVAGLSITFNYLTLTESTVVYTHESSCSPYSSYVYIRSFNWIFKVSVFISIPVFIVLLVIIFLAVKATNSTANRRQPSNSRGVVNVMLVVFTFLACFGPYQFISFYLQYSPESYMYFAILAKVLERLIYVHGFCTPLLYSLRMTDVKKGYTLMFKKCVSAASDYQNVFTSS